MRYLGAERYACTDDAKQLTAAQLIRHQARLRPLVVRPRRHAFIQGDVPTYLGAEARVFNLIQRFFAFVSVSQTGRGISVATREQYSWTGVYLADLMTEAERPLSWTTEQGAGALYLLSNPTSALRLAGIWLANQRGNPAVSSQTLNADPTFYGGVENFSGATTTLLTPQLNANAGLVFLGMFALTGASLWRDAAIRCGHWLRNWQRVDLRNADYTATSSGGTTRLYVGGWAQYQSNASTVTSARFRLADAHALRFLARLRDEIGGNYILGSDAAASYVTQPAATLDTMIAEAREFYVTGKPLTGTTPTPLFSTTNPKSYYYAFLGSGAGGDTAGDGLWHLDGAPETSITGQAFAMGLRGLYEVEGYSATVASLFEYLMSFSSNATYEPSASASEWDLANTSLGVYDPELAMAQTLTVDNGSGTALATNGSAVYDFAATGLLAPLYIASGRSLRATKDLFAEGRRIRANDSALVYASPTAVTSMGTFGISQDIVLAEAAMAGELYRWEPKGQIQNRGVA